MFGAGAKIGAFGADTRLEPGCAHALYVSVGRKSPAPA
jgi:hypothetical protein